MKYHDISEALIFHAVSMEHSPQPGNQLTLKEAQKSPLLHPVWSFLPPRTGETPPPEAMVKEMQQVGSRVSRLFPKRLHFDLEDWCMDNTFEILSKHKIPVIIDFWKESQFEEQTDWKALYSLCSRYPNLSVISTEFRTFTNRRMYQVMEKCPNLHLEISPLWSPFRLIEDLCKEFGAERLIFGTRMPIRNPATTIGLINYTLISEEEKALIAAKNLQKLMRGVHYG